LGGRGIETYSADMRTCEDIRFPQLRYKGLLREKHKNSCPHLSACPHPWRGHRIAPSILGYGHGQSWTE
jgi:hypothetical protein